MFQPAQRRGLPTTPAQQSKVRLTRLLARADRAHARGSRRTPSLSIIGRIGSLRRQVITVPETKRPVGHWVQEDAP